MTDIRPFWGPLAQAASRSLRTCRQSELKHRQALHPQTWFTARRLGRQAFKPVSKPPAKHKEGHGKRQKSLPPAAKRRKLEGETKVEVKNKPEAAKARKIRIAPSGQTMPKPEWRRQVRQWLGTVRWTWNQALAALRRGECKGTLKSLRAHVTNQDSPIAQAHSWSLQTPSDLREAAIRDLLKAAKTENTLCRKRKQKFHWKRINFRSRDKFRDTLEIRGRDWKRKRGAYAKLLSPVALTCGETLPETIDYSFRISMDSLYRFWLLLPLPLEQAPVTSAETRRRQQWQTQEPQSTRGVVSIDPGVRTFATCYDADTGSVSEWGVGDMARLFRLCQHADKLKAKRASKKPELKVRAKTRWRLKFAIRRVQERVRNLVDEVHKKLTLWLCHRHRVVLLPKFDSAKMAQRAKRKLSSKGARQMLTWSHYRFRERLLSRPMQGHYM